MGDAAALKAIVANVKEVYSVTWNRSAHCKYSPADLAAMRGHMHLCEILNTQRKNVTALPPKTDIEWKSQGSYNFCTFGHAVRAITVSRGNKEGNNALLASEGNDDHYCDNNERIIK